MTFLHVPQVGVQAVRLSAADEQLLLAIAHPEDAADLFATDADPDVRRLGRLALRRQPPQAADYFTLGDLCAQRAAEGERLNVFYVMKALQAYKRAARLARAESDRALARLAQTNFATWAVNMAHSTPSANNISVALLAVAESSSERLNDETRAAALELTEWYAAALRATVPPAPLTASAALPSWLDDAAEELISDETHETETEENTSDAISSRAVTPVGMNIQHSSERAAHSDDFERGELIGERYRVQNILEGGMGIIYICADEQTEMLVALKTFQARYLSDETAKRRFENEARLWIEMDKHPNIVRAYKVAAFGKSRLRERPHIILEYVSGAEGLGSDLRGWIKHKRLTLQLSLEIALGICNGMAHAVTKKEGFVHRDLKPANILVRHDGVAKVTDFGLGRAFDSLTDSQEMPLLSPEQLKQLAEARLTQTGRVMGTLIYMAPEQYTPHLQPLDARADIFAFGVILYEMLTGIRLFSGASTIQALRTLHSRPISFPPELAERLPQDVQQLTLRCLQIQREARPQTWQALRDELACCYQALTGQPPPLESSPAALQRDELMDKAYSLTELKRYESALATYEQALALDSNSAWIWARKGRVLRLLKRYTDALAALERALALQPAFAWAWYNKGIVHERLKEYAEALTAYAQAAEINPHDVWAAYNRARLLLERGALEAALQGVQTILNIDADHALSHVLRGRILLRLRQPREALAAFEQALQLDRELGEALIGRGEALSALQRHAEATSAFLQASRLLPKDVSTWLRLADVYLLNGNVAEAQSALEQASRLRPERSAIWLRLGRLHLHHNRPAEALDAYEKILARQPRHATALMGKGLALLALKRYAEAALAFEAVLAEHPDDLNARSRLGMAYLRNGDAAKALDAFERALQQRDDQAWLWAKRALALQQLQRYDDAVAAWRRAIDLKPAQAWYCTQLAALQARRRQLAEALALCEQAIDAAPDDAWAHYLRGTLLERLKRFPEALDAHKRALQCAPHTAWYHLSVARLLARLGRHEEALQACLDGLALPINNLQHTAQLWTQRGESFRRLRRYTEALECFDKAQEIMPSLPMAWEGAGLVRIALGEQIAALQALKQATLLRPENAWFWYNYGAALIECGDYAEAIRALNRALSLKPEFRAAALKRREARRKLNNKQQ
jgi:tetratricopeptide (TPR) repeat protein/tRNA A-37 threonylcarbamoyl transferase component Bud32